MDRFSKCIVAARSISKCVISNHSFLIVVCFYANVNTAISIFFEIEKLSEIFNHFLLFINDIVPILQFSSKVWNFY